MTFAYRAISWTKYLMLSMLFVFGCEYMYIEAIELNLDRVVVSIIVLISIAVSHLMGALFFRNSKGKDAIVSGAILISYGLLRFSQKNFVWTVVLLAIPALVLITLFFYLMWRRRDVIERKAWQCFRFSAVTALSVALVLTTVPALVGFNSNGEDTDWETFSAEFINTKTPESADLSDYSEVMKCLNNWAVASDDARRDCIYQIAVIEMKALGIENIGEIEVKVEPIDEGMLGYYLDEESHIKISLQYLRERDMEDTVKTVLHEVFHAYEFHIIKTLDFDSEQVKNGYYFRQAREWKNNVDNGYISPAISIEAYREQPLERDADKYAEERFPEYLEAMKGA